MNNANQILVAKLDAACRLVEKSDFGFAAGITKEHTLVALGNLRRQLMEKGSMDLMEARMLFAPTAGLEEVAMQNGWGRQYLELAQEVERVLVRVKEHQ